MAVPRIGQKVVDEHQERLRNLASRVETEESLASAPRVPPITPDEASAALMEYLPDDTQRLAKEAAKYLNVSVWQLLLGYVMRCWDGALMYSPYLLSGWETGGKPNKPRPCATCGSLFESRFPDAQYCCNPCAFGKLGQFGHAHDCPALMAGTVST